jgi:hypothetical protein
MSILDPKSLNNALSGQFMSADVKFFEPFVYAGSWCISGSWIVNVKEKPTDEQIKNTEQLLGWKWGEPI